MQPSNSPMKMPIRSPLLDLLRGMAVIFMIIFHFSYDLNLLGFLTFDIAYHPFWYFFPRLIVFMFLFCVGISLGLTYNQQFPLYKYQKRLLILASASLLVSVATFILFRSRWIYFGTLHCITFVSIIGPFFVRIPKISLLGFVFLFSLYFLDFSIPWIKLSHASMDYISPFPWMGAALLGIFIAHRFNSQLFYPINTNTPLIKWPIFLGKHSLIVYLIHQPILFSVLWLIAKMITLFKF